MILKHLKTDNMQTKWSVCFLLHGTNYQVFFKAQLTSYAVSVKESAFSHSIIDK